MPGVNYIGGRAYLIVAVQLDLVECAKAHLRAKVEHQFRIIKCQYGFRKVYYRGIKKIDLKLKMLFALANLWVTSKHRSCLA